MGLVQSNFEKNRQSREVFGVVPNLVPLEAEFYVDLPKKSPPESTLSNFLGGRICRGHSCSKSVQNFSH